MPRLNVVDPAAATGKSKELFDGPLAKKQLNIFKGMANSGDVLGAFLGFSGGIKGGALTGAEHEVIALVMGALNNCDYCTAVHTKVAAGFGISEDAATAIRKCQSDDPKQQALITFIKAIVETKGNVKDEDIADFRNAGYGDDAIVEVVGGIAVNTFTNLFNHVNDTEIDAVFLPAPAAV